MRSAMIAIALTLGFLGATNSFAADPEVTAVLDKAIKALGGEEKLAKAGTATWKERYIDSFMGPANAATTIIQGHDRMRFECGLGRADKGEKVVAVLDKDTGWYQSGNEIKILETEELAEIKRSAYRKAGVMTILPLKGPGFKVEKTRDGKLDGMPTAVLKVTGPDGKDFAIDFDKESGLPVKTSNTYRDIEGNERLQELFPRNYKDFGGVKVATRIDLDRNPKSASMVEISEYKILDKPDVEAFAKPK